MTCAIIIVNLLNVYLISLPLSVCSSPVSAGAGSVPGECERHVVPAQALEQADPEGPRALHTYAAVAAGPAGAGPQSDDQPHQHTG